MISPDSGEVYLFGKKLSNGFNLWNDIGYLVETPYSYPNLSVFDNLKLIHYLRRLKDLNSIDQIIEKLKLSKYRDIKAKNLSLGNKQRLGLAKAFMHQPKLLILDEPINGLDPEGIVEVRQLFKELANNGTTIFISSHILGEISKMAHRLAIIHEGKLVKELTSQQLNQEVERKLIIDTSENENALKVLNSNGFKVNINAEQQIECRDINTINKPESLSRFLVEQGFPPRQLFQYTEDLEMYFLRMIKSK